MNLWRCFRDVIPLFSIISLCLTATSLRAEDAPRPNVLFIAMDDLNDWIGCMGGHPQTITPNLDRLAESGVLFTNAHCTAPACNPSRSAIFTGRSPHRSGLYENGQKMREVLPDAEIIPKVFSRHGYHSAGSGKMLHYFIDAASWDEYFPEAEKEDPFPRTLYPEKRPLSLPRGGPWQYVETDWGPLDATDEEFGGDYLVAEWISKELSRDHDKPFFLACGFYRPHEPWFVPAKYFEPFPLDSIQLPQGYRADDLEDLPSEGKRRGPNRYFAHIQKEGQWKQGIQGYLASIYFADTMLGKVLDGLEHGPHAGHTIVVLWSDHGWHLGEKEHWQKYTGWRVCTRIPLIIRVPPKSSGVLDAGTSPSKCNRPVNLLSLFPTLLELCGLPPETFNDGPSLVPLLRDPEAEWAHVSVTHLADPGSYGLSTDRWRLIHYANGEEELYDIAGDPYEFQNLAAVPDHQSTLERLRKLGPSSFAEKKEASIDSLPALTWNPVKDEIPASRPDGNPFDVYFLNHSERLVKLFWMDRQGKTKHYADIAAGKQQRQQTRPGAVWMISDSEERPLGFFRVGDRKSKAIVPALDSSSQDKNR